MVGATVDPCPDQTDATSAGTSDGGPRLLFLGGLHRSGTSLLFRLLREHPAISGFRGTGSREDEGQHLQSVYPPAKVFGGEGRFGFHPEARMLERAPEVARGVAATLFEQWSRHWDLARPVLIEKSPPNLVRTRYLQSLFPEASFVMIMRHPVEVVLAQRRRAEGQSLSELLRHWFVCHDLLAVDIPLIARIRVVRYEDLIRDPERTLTDVLALVGLSLAPECSTAEVSDSAQQRYAAEWRARATGWSTKHRLAALIRRFEPEANRYGYSLQPDGLPVPAPGSGPSAGKGP